jgi:hypothetical protein
LNDRGLPRCVAREAAGGEFDSSVGTFDPGRGDSQRVEVQEVSVMIRVYSSIVLAGFVVVAGCDQPDTPPSSDRTTSDDVRRDIGKAVDTTNEYAGQTKEEYQQKLDARLQELDAEIAKLQEKGEALKADAKVKWEENMADLRIKRDAARVKLAELQDSSSEAWKDLQVGAQAAWEEMEQAFQKASSEF